MFITRALYRELTDRRTLVKTLNDIYDSLQNIQRRLDTMPTQADLDTAIANVGTVFQKLATDVKAAVAALEAKLAAVAPAADFTAEIGQLKSIADEATALDVAAVAANPPATTTTP